MSDAIKIGPLWNRTVFDPSARTIKFRMRPVARWDEVKQFRIRELITIHEEEQLLNAHPDVQKDRRPAELWLDLKDGKAVQAGESEGAGLLLAALSDVSRQLGVPIMSERKKVAEAAAEAMAAKKKR
jgi:hypothetical protein